MKILIENKDLKFYKNQTWIEDPNQAQEFRSAFDAIQLCQRLDLKDVYIVLKFETEDETTKKIPFGK